MAERLYAGNTLKEAAAAAKELGFSRNEVYRATLARFPQCRTAVNNLAFLLVREGRVEEARECLGRMPELYPHAGSMRLTVEGAR